MELEEERDDIRFDHEELRIEYEVLKDRLDYSKEGHFEITIHKLKKENEKLKENITDHPDFVEAAIDWYERHNWMIDEDEYEELQKENEELKKENKNLKQVVDNETGHNRMLEKKYKKLKEENKELKEKL